MILKIVLWVIRMLSMKDKKYLHSRIAKEVGFECWKEGHPETKQPWSENE